MKHPFGISFNKFYQSNIMKGFSLFEKKKVFITWRLDQFVFFFLLLLKSFEMLLKLVLLLLGIVSSIAIPNGTIHLPIFKNERVKINKRSEVHHAMLYNNDGSEYLVNIGIGTPIQNFSVSLDTGR